MEKAQELWKQHKQHIEPINQTTDFLHIDLRKNPDFDQVVDGSQLSEPIFNWLHQEGKQQCFLLLTRNRKEQWASSSPWVTFQEFVEYKNTESPNLRGCVWKHELPVNAVKTILQQHDNPLSELARQQSAAILSPKHPFCLELLKIPKPWGYEGWYTGVEQRGVVKVSDGFGSTEIPYALSLFKSAVLAAYPEDLILLKTLNPVCEEVYGDLYLEMHEQKWEVYLVTDIDPIAWPSGIGIIKAGFNANKVEEYTQIYGDAWKTHYLREFQNDIQNYESIRRDIDQQIDQLKQNRGINPTEPVSPSLMEEMLQSIPASQLKKEAQLRQKTVEYTGDCPVSVGDVVTFPTYQMHSLQHGIRVIEFQTPHYERLIVMFAQKVLTQNHWDTEKALSLMAPEVYKRPELKVQEQSSGTLNERFVDFPGFTADRITLAPHTSYEEQTGDQYHLLITVTGIATLQTPSNDTFELIKEEAFFVPNSMGHYRIINNTDEVLVTLKAMPAKKN